MVKRVLTSIITLTLLMGVLVACGDYGSSQNSGNAVLSLDEKIYYSDYCDQINFNCQSEIEYLAQRIIGGTEEEKQNYLSAFIVYIDCKKRNSLLTTKISELESEITQLEADRAYSGVIRSIADDLEAYKNSLRDCKL